MITCLLILWKLSYAHNMNPGDSTPPEPTYLAHELLTECKAGRTSNMSKWHITDYYNKAAFVTYHELSGPGLEKHEECQHFCSKIL